MFGSSCGSSRNTAGSGALGDGGVGPGAFVDEANNPNGEVATCDQAKTDKSTMGCDFYSVVPDSPTITRGSCYAAFLVNTANTNVRIEVERDGTLLSTGGYMMILTGSGSTISYAPVPSSGLPPGQVAVLFLSQNGAGFSTKCPGDGIHPAIPAVTSVTGTGRGSAFHIKTSAPVVAYDIYPYGGGASALTSATLLLPTTAWDTN